MRIEKVQNARIKQTVPACNKNKHFGDHIESVNSKSSNTYAKIPLEYRFGAKINFTGKISEKHHHRRRAVPDIDYDYYMSMSKNKKQMFRHIYYDLFEKRKYTSQLFNPQNVTLPLKNEHVMDEFIKTAQIYTQYKDRQIVCLGRSPKWFLDAASWMKDGIKDFTFIAFSGYWFYPHYIDGIRYIEGAAPTPEETAAYRRYLISQQADPASIIKRAQNAGKRAIITDYIDTGKGFSSFLDLMAKFAKDQGVINEFPNCFEIVTIGSLDYIDERLNLSDDSLREIPEVKMPPSLAPYAKTKGPEALYRPYKIPQRYHDVNYSMFCEMLLNQNTNECRSTYYPHSAWTIYRPDRFKTGLITDMSKIKKLLEETDLTKASLTDFSLPMADFRNLLNFRILDALNARKLLKAVK